MSSHPSRPAPLSPDGISQASRNRSVQVLWYDGSRSKPWPTWAVFRPGPNGVALSLHPMDGAASNIQLRAHQVNWPEIWSQRNAQAPLIVDLGEHGTLEVHDVNAWQEALHAMGHPTTVVNRLQHSWRWLLLSLVVAVALIAAFYRWGTPWTATQLARLVPLDWEQQISRQYLSQLDESSLRPSKVAPERQAQLRQAFDELLQRMPSDLPMYANYQPQYQLEFRSGMGANAFALPGGLVVMTDDIIRHAQRQNLPDDALIGVLAHEIGHVANRHTSRAVLQQAVLQTGISLALGDLSSLAATSATVLTSLSYSRAHEREADCFAIALMQATGKPTKPMGDLLLSLDAHDSEDEAPAQTDAANAPPASASPASGAIAAASAPREAKSDWYHTHPDTVTRAQALSQGHAPSCR